MESSKPAHRDLFIEHSDRSGYLLGQKRINFSQPACQGHLSFFFYNSISRLPGPRGRGTQVFLHFFRQGPELFVREYRPISADVFAADIAAAAQADPALHSHLKRSNNFPRLKA